MPEGIRAPDKAASMLGAHQSAILQSCLSMQWFQATILQKKASLENEYDVEELSMNWV